MTETCSNGHAEVEMVETDEGLKCMICDDVEMYTEDKQSSESSDGFEESSDSVETKRTSSQTSPVGTGSDTEDKT